MAGSPEDVIRETLQGGVERPLTAEVSRDALAALVALVGERDDLTGALQEQEAELARLRRVEETARGVLEASSGRRSATQVLSAMAALRAALKAPE
jgi:AmiR/NasT family two-component response regulator